MKQSIKLILASAVLIGSASAYYAYSEFTRTAESLRGMKVDATLAAQELLDKCDVDGEESFNLQYLDKVVEISGEMTDMSAKGDSVLVATLIDDMLSSVIVNFDMRDIDDGLPKVGTSIQVIGKVSGCNKTEGDLLSGSTVNLINAILK